jgi:hypothetical protein
MNLKEYHIHQGLDKCKEKKRPNKLGLHLGGDNT